MKPCKQRLLAAVLATARDLRAAGCIDAKRMKDYERMCVIPKAGKPVKAAVDSLARISGRGRG